jgi:hypothetical protein
MNPENKSAIHRNNGNFRMVAEIVTGLLLLLLRLIDEDEEVALGSLGQC